MRLIIFFTLMLSMRSGVAGGWSSGGGEIFRDAANPWFLKNDKTVSYCINIGDSSFRNTIVPIEKIVDSSIRYWQQEFARANLSAPTYPYGRVEVATQNFVKVDCSVTNVDLQFQFGELSEVQKMFLGDPTRYLGIAVRTDYDSVTLRGKGFIYISPDSGPMQYQRTGLLAGAWHKGDGGLLFRVLVHELGHVFGLPHSKGLMGQDYPETLLTWPRVAQYFIASSTPFFEYLPTWTSQQPIFCTGGGLGFTGDLFGVSKAFSCLAFQSDRTGFEISVLAKENFQTKNWTHIGTIQFGPADINFANLHGSDGVHVILPSDQTVFPDRYAIDGAQLISRQYVGEYHSVANNLNSQIILLTTPTSAQFGGITSGGKLNLSVFTLERSGW